MLGIVPFSLLLGAVAASYRSLPQRPGSIFKRADSGTDICDDLSVSSNNGNRKVAIVIDESGSMASSDPSLDSLKAAKELNSFLIANGEGSKPDQIAIIRFDDTSTVEYSLGDPGSADAAIDRVGNSGGGTYIAGGVELAIEELTSKDTNTKDRTAIVVFTDGEDSLTAELVTQIERAGKLGIRVSFGFLSLLTTFQDPTILNAVRESRGIYATIADASGATNYVKYAILNGLTYNDNPQGFDERLLSGLAQTYTISGSNSITLKYRADKAENVSFSITSISAGSLKAVAKMGGTTLAKGDTSSSSFGLSSFGDTMDLAVVVPKDGDIEVKIQAAGAPSDSLLSVLTLSDVPIKNCTIGVKKEGGTSTGVKVGAGLGTILGLAILGTGGYLAWKYFHSPTPPHPPPNSSMGPSGGDFMSKPGGTVSVEPLYNIPPQPPVAPPGGPTYPVMAVPPLMPPHPSNPDQQRAGNEYPYSEKPMQQGYPPKSPMSNSTSPTSPYGQPPPSYPYGQQPTDTLYNPTQPTNLSGSNPYQAPTPYGGDPTSNPSLQQPTQPYQQPTDPFQQPPTDRVMDLPTDPSQQQPPTDPSQQPPSDNQPPNQPDIPDHPDRLPKIKRGTIEKHHHHHYLDPRQECLAEHCEYNQEHTCTPNQDTCPCTCRDPKCPVTKERERIQREKDGIHTLLANTL